MSEIGSRLKSIRMLLHINQAQLAEVLSVGQGTVSKLELGVQTIDADHLITLYQAYAVNPMYLLLGQEPSILSQETTVSTLKTHITHIKNSLNSIEKII